MPSTIVLTVTARHLGTGGPSHRNLTFNGTRLTRVKIDRLEMFERVYRIRLPELAYWYDDQSGAVGLWGGPLAGFLPAGLELGGPLKADCSGGGTGVFINGRELHPIDVMELSRFTPVRRGHWWMDEQGAVGRDGEPAAFRLEAIASDPDAGPWNRRVGNGTPASNHACCDSFYLIDSDGRNVPIGHQTATAKPFGPL